MDIFIKKRFIVWIIIILVILNLSTLAVIWFFHIKGPRRPPPMPPIGPEQGMLLLDKELNLSETQVQKFKESRDRYFVESKPILDEIHRLKMEIMDEVFAPSPDPSKVKRIAKEIGEKQAKFEELLFDHFLSLREACNPEQEVKLKDLFRDLFEFTKPPLPLIPLRKSRPQKGQKDLYKK